MSLIDNCKIFSYSKSLKDFLAKKIENIQDNQQIHKDYIEIGAGFHIDDFEYRNMVKINMQNTNRKGHMFCFGTTGSGKSRLIEIMIEQDIMNGHNVIVIDPKLDNELLSRAYQSCVKADRMNEFMLISTVYPEISTKINPLANYYIIDEIINHTVASVPAKDPFFYSIAQETTSAIVYSRLIEKNEYKDDVPLNFYDIYKYVSHAGLTQLEESLLKIKSNPINVTKEEVEVVLNLLKNVLSSPVEYFGKVTTTLRTTLTQLTIGSVGKVIGHGNSNKFISKLDNDEGVVLYVQTPSMLSKLNSDTLSKTVLSMIQSSIGRRNVDNRPFEKPLSIYIDEASNSLYMGIENLFNKSRSANVMISAFSQSFADLDDAVGKEKAKMILANTNTKIFLKLVDIDTAESVARYGGESTQYSSLISSQNLMMREDKKEILEPRMFLDLKPREFYYFGFEGSFKGKVKKVSGSEIKVVMPKKGN